MLEFIDSGGCVRPRLVLTDQETWSDGLAPENSGIGSTSF